ncbi:O-methyltransferas-like protein [Aspergillus uvarum CBS 121591]|uniref:O-methyltransferas-like protein n=1 Tax=Aspergillus uvarum CBS 121591 TaxID=1448315 RepID=A0A319CJK6_9EURO|nr:O-methyltransferas-like protein [Aspergillus uvarum CBS 121591]PYH84529.1 O-methyltransferas-like protein [Aspergillus uvarum CBS 121591]
MNLSRIVELATRIQELAKERESYLQENDIQSPSFDEDGPVELRLSGHMLAAREEVLSSTLEHHNLFLGPSNCLRPVLNGVSLQAIYIFDIARHVPVHGVISFKELAEKYGLDAANLRRTLQFAMAYHHVFREPRKGFVGHTAASRRLVDDPTARAGLGYMFKKVWQGFSHTLPALEQYHSDDPGRTGWAHYHNTDMPPWQYYSSHPEMAGRFAVAMFSFANGHHNAPSFLVQGLLAPHYPELRLIVQDLPSMVDGAAESLPTDVRDKVTFQAHDFFTPQPVQANAYLFRNIFHNWSDSHGVQILQALVPALRPGARIIVSDYLLPELGTLSLLKERAVRDGDMIMFRLFNSKEREEADWIELFRKADSRFAKLRIWTPEEAWMAIIEAVWEP